MVPLHTTNPPKYISYVNNVLLINQIICVDAWVMCQILTKGWFTLWTMKSSLGRLSDVIGRWSCPGTTWVYTKEKMAEW
jgi:hypothetical protein